MTVLIVDGDTPTRKRLQRLLNTEGAETNTASNINDGLLRARDWQPAVIVVSPRFSHYRSNGIAAIGDFRRASPRSEVIVLVDEFDQSDAQRALASGAFGYLKAGDDVALQQIVVGARLQIPTSFWAVTSSLLH